MWLQIAAIVISLYSADQQKKKQKALQEKMKIQAQDQAATRDVRISGSNKPIPIIYGYSRIEPVDVYTNVASSYSDASPTSSEDVFGNLGSFSGNKNETLICQRVVAASEISKYVWADIDDVDYNDAKYNNWVRFFGNRIGGTLNQSPTLARDNSALFNDLAYVTEFFRMNREDPQFSGKPVTSYYVEGRKVRRFSNGILSTQKSFSNNTVEVLTDYLFDTTIGPGLTEDDIDLVSFSKAAAVCDQVVKESAAVSGKIFAKRNINTLDIRRHSFNGVLYPDKDHIENISTILKTIVGVVILRSAEGKLKLSIPDPTLTSAQASEREINDSILVSDIEYSQPDANARLNNIKVTYTNSAKDFTSDSYEFKNNAYFEQDNEVLLSTEVDITGIANVYQASGVAHAMMNESRAASYIFKCSHQIITLEPGDIIRLKSDRNDIDRYVRITSLKMDESSTVQVESIAYDPSIYTYDSSIVENNYNRLDFDFIVDPPTNVYTQIVTNDQALYNSVRLNWTDAADSQVIEYIVDAGVVQDNQIVYTTIGIVPFGVGKLIHNPSLPTTYYYRVRARTRLGRMSVWASSASTIVSAQQVIGGFSVVFGNYNLEFKRSVTSGATSPTTNTTTLELFTGTNRAPYQTGNTLSKGEWKLVSDLSGALPNQNGTYVVSVSNNIATITVSPLQNRTEPFSTTMIPLVFKYNGTVTDQNIDSTALTTLTRYVTVIEARDGIDGATGARGAGWFRAVEVVSQTTLDGYSSGTITTKFVAYIGLSPVINDRFIIAGTGTAVKAWIFNGSAWINQAAFIDGNLLVDGTVNADSLDIYNSATGFQVTINGSGLTIRSAADGTSRTVMTKDTIKVYEGNTVRVHIGNLDA